MTPAQLATRIRFYTKTNSTTLTDATLLPLVNDARRDLSEQAMERAPEKFLVPATENLVANQREYAFDSNILERLHKVECKFSANDARIPLIPLKDYRLSETEAEIVKRFANTEGSASYIVRRNAILILSGTITAVTAGLRTWFAQYPPDIANDLTDTTDMSVAASTTSAPFPRPLHDLCALWVSIAYKSNRPKPIPLSKRELQYDQILEQKLAVMSRGDAGLEIIGESPPSQDLWNDGFDL